MSKCDYDRVTISSLVCLTGDLISKGFVWSRVISKALLTSSQRMQRSGLNRRFIGWIEA